MHSLLLSSSYFHRNNYLERKYRFQMLLASRFTTIMHKCSASLAAIWHDILWFSGTADIYIHWGAFTFYHYGRLLCLITVGLWWEGSVRNAGEFEGAAFRLSALRSVAASFILSRERKRAHHAIAQVLISLAQNRRCDLYRVFRRERDIQKVAIGCSARRFGSYAALRNICILSFWRIDLII